MVARYREMPSSSVRQAARFGDNTRVQALAPRLTLRRQAGDDSVRRAPDFASCARPMLCGRKFMQRTLASSSLVGLAAVTVFTLTIGVRAGLAAGPSWPIPEGIKTVPVNGYHMAYQELGQVPPSSWSTDPSATIDFGVCRSRSLLRPTGFSLLPCDTITLRNGMVGVTFFRLRSKHTTSPASFERSSWGKCILLGTRVGVRGAQYSATPS